MFLQAVCDPVYIDVTTTLQAHIDTFHFNRISTPYPLYDGPVHVDE